MQGRGGQGWCLKAGEPFFQEKQLLGSRDSQGRRVLEADCPGNCIYIANVGKEILVLSKNPYRAK